MFDITKLLLRIPNVLTKEECQVLIQEYDESQSQKEYSLDANVFEFKEATFKVFEVTHNSSNFNFIKNKTKEIVNKYIHYLNTSNYFHKSISHSLRFSHKYRILKYGQNAQIHPHSDHSPFIYGSITLNLNDDYEGGEFSFFNNNYKIKLKQGEAIIFPADYFWVHEVNPITKGVRYSLNSFLSACPEDVRKNTLDYYNEISTQYFNNTPPNQLLGPYND